MSCVKYFVVLSASVAMIGCGSAAGPITSKTTNYEVGEEAAAAPANDQVSGDVSASAPSSLDGPANSPSREAPARPRTLAQSQPQDTGIGSPSSPAPPIGSPAEQLLAEIQRLQQEDPRGVTEAEMVDDFINIQRRIVTAAESLLSMDAEQDLLLAAAGAKVNALASMDSQGVGGARKQLFDFTDSLQQHPLPAMAKLGRQLSFGALLDAFATDENADVQPVMDGFQQMLAAEDKDRRLLMFSQRVASLVLDRGFTEAGAELMRLTAEGFKDNPDPQLAQAADSLLQQAAFAEVDLGAKLDAVAAEKPGALDAWSEALTKLVTGTHVGRSTLSNLYQLGGGLESGSPEAAAKIYEAIEAGFADHPNTELAEQAKQYVERYQRRSGLVGKPFAIEGVLADGTPFDWSQYKGKVVLVDFWATWCQPCLAELPNIRENFQKYHPEGFEVVGVNLDQNRQQFDQFIDRQPLPWTNVLASDPEAEHPMAAKYGVDAIPFLVLVDRDGTAIALNLRGQQLSDKLAELFPASPPADGTPAPEAATSYRMPSSKFETEFHFVALSDETSPDTAQDEASGPGLDLSDINPYAPRKGLSPDELVEFILDMQEKSPSIQRRDGFAEAMVEAADRILAAETKDQHKRVAGMAKLEALHKRAMDGDSSADETLMDAVAELRNLPHKQIADAVAFLQLERRLLQADQLPPEEVPSLLADVKSFAENTKLDVRHLRLASATIAAVNRLEPDHREDYFQQFGKLFAASNDKELASYGRRIARTEGRKALDLVGKPIEIAGVTSLGAEFDWASYRGQVVLVDFWATWCAPCRREMPHIQALRERLRGRGFDVVGISLDQDLEALAAYLDEHAMPWANLAGAEGASLAKQLGIAAIPTMLVVDAAGIVVAIGHRVEDVQDDIEQLLPAA